MRNAFLAVSLLPCLLAGTEAMAAERTQGLFSGALSYESLAVPDHAANRHSGLSAGGYSVDLYKSDIGPLGLSVGTGFARVGQGGEPDGYMVGLRLDYGGLSLASQWRGRDDGNCGLSETGCEAGPAWNIGASYSMGDASLSARYEALNPLGTDGQGPGGDVYRLGVDYQLFDGVTSGANAYFIDGDKGFVEGDSTVVLIGTRITF